MASITISFISLRVRKCGFTDASRAKIRIFTPRDIKFRTILVMYYYPILTRKTAAFVTCRAVRKRGNARPYSKSRKKSEERRCKNRKILLGCILKVEKKVRRSVIRIFFFRLYLKCSHKMEMKYSEEGTLGQRQRYPLPSFTAVVTHELSRTEHNLRRSVFENIFDNFCVIIGNGEFNHTGVKCNCTFNFKEPQLALTLEISAP